MPLVKFAYNNNYQASVGMAPYEAFYGRRHRSLIYWDDIGEKKLLGSELVQVTTKKVALIRERLKTSQSRHKSFADKQRQNLEFQVRDHVFLKVSPVNIVMRFERKKKVESQLCGTF